MNVQATAHTENVAIDIKTLGHDMAVQVLRMAKNFYSDPENTRKFAEWHKKKYGCLPEGAKNRR